MTVATKHIPERRPGRPSTLRVRLRPGRDASSFEDDGSPAFEVLVHLEL